MLREDLNKIKSPRNLLVFADKTMNLYYMPPNQYKTLPNNSITKTHCKLNSNAKRSSKKQAKKTLQRSELRGQDGMLH